MENLYLAVAKALNYTFSFHQSSFFFPLKMAFQIDKFSPLFTLTTISHERYICASINRGTETETNIMS